MGFSAPHIPLIYPVNAIIINMWQKRPYGKARIPGKRLDRNNKYANNVVKYCIKHSSEQKELA